MNTQPILKGAIAVCALFSMQARVIGVSGPEATPPPTELTAPDKQSFVSIEHRNLPSSDPQEGFFTLVMRVRGTIVLEVPTMGYLLDAFWSPNNEYVAVNNRRSNAGDYLWVFSLHSGEVLKAPDDRLGEVLAQMAAEKFPELARADFDRFSNLAKGWSDSRELEVESRIVFRRPSAVIVRHALYGVTDGKLALRREDFEKAPAP